MGWMDGRVDGRKAVGWMDEGADEQRQIWGGWMKGQMSRDRYGVDGWKGRWGESCGVDGWRGR